MLDEIEFKQANPTQQVQVDPGDFLNALEKIPEVWFNFLLAESLTLDVPWFHIDIFELLISFIDPKFALAVPRGHAKTTIVKLAIVHYFTFSKIRFIVYCSNTSPIAKAECKDIVNMIESENYISTFGQVEWETKNESEGIWIFKLKGKRCILRSLGAQQQVRGMNMDNMRPELLICDDAEDAENTSTTEQQRKFKKWVYGPLFKACARHSKKIWIGNLIGQHCLINTFCESDSWSSIKYGCITEQGEALWPEMFDLEYLRTDFLEYQANGETAIWFAEMMNMPIPEGMGLIKPEDIKYNVGVDAGELQSGFITIDPAISKKTTANNSGIAVHGLVKGKWQIVETVKAKVGPIELFEIAYYLCCKWRIRAIGIEAIAYQAALEPFFRYLLINKQEHSIEIFPLMSGTARKTERIVTWAGWLKEGSYSLTLGDTDITKQLLMYDPTKEDNDDDVIDACAYGPQMITKHLNLIMLAGDMNKIAAQTVNQICTL